MNPKAFSGSDTVLLGKAASGRVLTAVFFIHLSETAGPMIAAWIEAGHKVSSIVVYRHKKRRFFINPVKWLVLEKALMRIVRRHRIRVVELSSPVDWDSLGRTLSASAPDIAISYSFMRLVPKRVLDRFPRGGVNFHPALLPYYRGPQPLQWLAIDGTWQRFGGVTLHEMTDEFDEGAIIAQAPIILETAGGDVGARAFATGAIACMTRDVIPRYCANEIRSWPQPAGVYPYAVSNFPDLVVQPHWTRDYLKRLCLVMTKRPGVAVEVSGRKVRLLNEASVLGPPSGKPAGKNWRGVEFDLADQRVVYRLYSPLRKLINSWNRLREFDTHTHNLPIRLGPFEGAGIPPSLTLKAPLR